MRTALVGAVTVLTLLGAAPAFADPTPAPPTPYQVPTQDSPVLPGNQVLPPVCAHTMWCLRVLARSRHNDVAAEGTSAP
jgi:hypothetical protein